MTLIEGTNCGFVTVAPTEDPEGYEDVIDYKAWAGKFVAPEGALKVTEIGWWCNTVSEAANFEVGIYTHNIGDNNPEAVVGMNQTNPKGTDAGWKRSTGLDISITPGETYWIVVQVDDTATPTNAVDYSPSSLKEDIKTNAVQLTDPWGVSNTTYAAMVGFYALYETAAPGAKQSLAKISEEGPSGDDGPGLFK